MAVADLEKIVKIIFAGEDTGLSKTINSVSKGLNGLSTTVKDATQPLADFSDIIVKTNLILGGLAIGGLVVATKAAGDFGDSFAEISTLITDPNANLEEFRKNVLGYATDSTASIDEITSATYQIISATGDWEKSLDLLTVAEKLNVAGKGELSATTKLLATSLNAYGLDVKSASDFSDILFTTVKVGVTNLDELNASLGSITGLAASAGVPFQDLGAAVGALTGTVGNTSLAVTQLKGILTAILGPGTAAQQMAKDLGIEFNTQALAAEGLEGFLKKVVEATGGNTEKMKVLFGRVEALNGALILGSDASGKFSDAMIQMSLRAGATQIAFDKMADNFKNNNQKIINSIQATLITIGIPLLDDWGDLAKGIAEVFKGVKVGFDAGAFDGLIDIVEEVAQGLADLFEGIGVALPKALEGVDFTGFETALRELVDTGKELLNNLFGGLDLTKPEDLRKAIQIVVDTFENWVNLTKGLVLGLQPFIEKIAELAGKFKDLDKDSVTLIGQITGFGKAVNTIANAIPALTGALKLLSTSIGLLSLTKLPALIKSFGLLAGPAGAGAIGAVVTAITGGAGLLAAFALIRPDAGIGKWLYDNSESFKNLQDKIDETATSLLGYDTKQQNARIEGGNLNVTLGKLFVAVDNFSKGLTGVPENVDTSIQLVDVYKLQTDFDLITGKISEIDKSEVEIEAGFKAGDIEKLESDWNTIKITLEDGTVQEIRVKSDKAITDAKDASEKIDKELEDKKVLIELQGEIDIELAKIKAQADTLQTAFEWSAKVEIAGIEAAAKELEAVAGTVEAAWQSTGDVISAALGVLSGTDLSGARWHDVIKIIDREQDLREEIWETQKLLVDAQTAMIVARTAALAKGEPIITITTDGLEPELEQVLYSIVQKAQVKANEEGFAALLGI